MKHEPKAPRFILLALILSTVATATFNYILHLRASDSDDTKALIDKLSQGVEFDSVSELRTCLAVWGTDHKDLEENRNIDGCPQQMPQDLADKYTMNGLIDVTDWYQCQTGAKYDAKHVYTKEQFEGYIDTISQGRTNYYGDTDLFIYQSIKEHPIKGKDMAIMGSQRPIYESVCLVFGAKSCTTIDFQPIVMEYDDPRLKSMTIAQFDQNPTRFDVAISISSFEHDGLGRYGDPIRPEGDLEMMKKMKCLLKPDGILILSVPIAKDKIVWNMHRVYGQVRLPKLLEYWTLLGVYGDQQMTTRWSGCDADREGDYQPIFILQNSLPPIGHNDKIMSKYLDPNFKPQSCFPNKQ